LSESQLEILKTIQNEFVKNLAGGKIEIAACFSMHGTAESGVRLEEHEQNAKNKRREANFLQDINK
jgi:hypothetical protein